MNELLQKHGCSNVFHIPDGLKELMADISREVLRAQPSNISEFIANYLSCLLVTREHGILAIEIVKDLCDCRFTVVEHLLQLNIKKDVANPIADLIKKEIEGGTAAYGKTKLKESEVMKKILKAFPLDEATAANVCQVIRKAYRDYWYRKEMLEKSIKAYPEEPWQKAAKYTLDIYKKTNPSSNELLRAAERIEAAYKGYHVRRKMLKKPVVPAIKKRNPKVNLSGPPTDIAESREINLGPIMTVQVQKVDKVDHLLADKDDSDERVLCITNVHHSYHCAVDDPPDLTMRSAAGSILGPLNRSAPDLISKKKGDDSRSTLAAQILDTSPLISHANIWNDEVPAFETNKIYFKPSEGDEEQPLQKQ